MAVDPLLLHFHIGSTGVIDKGEDSIIGRSGNSERSIIFFDDRDFNNLVSRVYNAVYFALFMNCVLICLARIRLSKLNGAKVYFRLGSACIRRNGYFSFRRHRSCGSSRFIRGFFPGHSERPAVAFPEFVPFTCNGLFSLQIRLSRGMILIAESVFFRTVCNSVREEWFAVVDVCLGIIGYCDCCRDFIRIVLNVFPGIVIRISGLFRSVFSDLIGKCPGIFVQEFLRHIFNLREMDLVGRRTVCPVCACSNRFILLIFNCEVEFPVSQDSTFQMLRSLKCNEIFAGSYGIIKD